MNTTIDRLKLIFLGLFFFGAVAAWGYQFFWVRPAKICESQARWWDGSTRTCATPLYIPSMTGRPEGVSREDWARQQAAKAQLRDRLGENAQGAEAEPAPAPPKAAAPQTATPQTATPKTAPPKAVAPTPAPKPATAVPPGK